MSSAVSLYRTWSIFYFDQGRRLSTWTGPQKIYIFTGLRWPWVQSMPHSIKIKVSVLYVTASLVVALNPVRGGKIIQIILATLVCSAQAICHRLQSIMARLYISYPNIFSINI